MYQFAKIPMNLQYNILYGTILLGHVLRPVLLVSTESLAFMREAFAYHNV